ncbi:hypothetical protein AB0F17_04835 [Nonomuraea sp. NPDC026600]|uniref:hypothetical protein n=1 Tax=Nonomuraea sp. NPDC026600 TaxID=3155363 RepID=UPI00340355C1
MTVLLSSEHLDGTPAEQHRLHSLLRDLRTETAPAPLPGITFQTLAQLLTARPVTVDLDLFRTGYELLATRYAEIGMRALLPPERVWIGVHSTAAEGVRSSDPASKRPAGPGRGSGGEGGQEAASGADTVHPFRLGERARDGAQGGLGLQLGMMAMVPGECPEQGCGRTTAETDPDMTGRILAECAPASMGPAVGGARLCITEALRGRAFAVAES